MRNKRLLILIAVMLIAVLTLSFVLVACKKKPDTTGGDTPSGDKPPTSGEEPGSGDPGPDPGDSGDWKPPVIVDPDPPEDEIPEYAMALKTAMQYMVASMPSNYLSIDFSGSAALNGKKYDMSLKGNISAGDVQMAAIFKLEGTNEIAFAVYFVNSKLFFENKDGVLLNISEIDTNYLLSIADKLPAKLSQLIKDLAGQYADFIDLGIDMLLSGFAPYDKITYSEENGVEKFNFGLDVQGITGMIGPLIELVGQIGVLPDNLDLSFINDFIDLIPLINGKLNATVDNGRLSEFNVEFYDNDPASENYGQTLLGFDSALTFGDKPIAIELPDGIENYESLTLGNLNADFTLTIDTNGEALDLGKLIDGFLEKPMFGEGILVLDGDAEYSLDIKTSLDPNLDGLAEDKNYVNAVLKAGENELVRINYLDGKLYVKALAAGVNGFAEGGINIAVPLDLKGYIEKLVKMVTDAIDNALGTEFKPQVEEGAVLTASVSRNGEVILSPSLQSAIVKILKLIGFEEYIIPSGDKITIVVNNDFLKAITDLAKLDPINLPIFGELNIGLFGGGIEYVEVKAMDVLTLRADNFLIGKAKIDRNSVLDSIGKVEDYDTDIVKIVKSFALNMLSDLDVSLDLDLSTVDTTVNLTPIINNIMAVANNSTYLKMPITLDLSNYDGIFKLRIATSYDEKDKTGRILFEIITPDGDTLISAYNEKDKTYVDLSGLGFMKFCLTNVDLFDLIRGLLIEKNFSDEDIEEVAPVMMMSAYSSGVEIGNDHIGAAVDGYFFTLIMRMLGMDLGLDVSLKAYLNFDGTVSAVLGLGNAATLGLDLALGKESQSGNRISDIISELPKAEYGEYNAIDADMLVDSILVSERLNLTLDLYNNNVDYPTHENKTRIVLRNSKATPEKAEVLDNGLEVPYKAIVLIIYSGWTDATSEALLYGFIDFDGKKVQIKGTAKMLTYVIGASWAPIYTVTGDLLNIPINDVDLKGMLANALSGLFGDNSDGENEDFGGAIEVPDGALPEQKPSKPEDSAQPDDSTQSEGEGSEATTPIEEILPGVKVTLSGSMDIDVDVDINGSYISKLLKDMLQGVFTDMDMSSMTGKTELITINYDNENKDVFFNDMYSKLLLPLIQEQVTKAAGNISIIGQIVSGIASSSEIKNQVHSLVGRFLPLPNIENLKVNVSLTDGKLANISAIGSNPGGNDALGFGIYIFNRKTDDVVSWENQATNIYFNPTLGGSLVDMFETRARKFTGTNWEEDSWQNITWTLKDRNVRLADFSANIADYADGEYIFVGRAWETSIEVKVTLHTAEIEYVKDMQVKAMRDIPTYVNAVFTDGTERMLTNVDIVCDGRVNSENNASVTFGENTYSFTIEFEEEAFTLDTLVVNAYDYLDVLNNLENSGVVKVKINDTFYRNLPATYDFEAIRAMTRQELQKPNTYDVNVHVGAGTDYECDMVLKVEFTPFDIYYIERNGLNYIETDFIEYAKGESFPSEITVVGYNGKEQLKYTAKVSEWNLDGVTIDLKGGQYFASAVLNKDQYNEWNLYGIEVDVVSTDIVDLADNSKSVVFDWKYYFYGNVSMESVVPSLLDFKTSDGTIKKKVPVTIDVSSIFADEVTLRKAMAEGMTFECPVSVDVENDGKSLFETTVSVVVPSIKMSLIETTINIDYADYMKYGKSAFFRDSIEIMLGKDKVTAKVTWFTDEVIFNKDGTYTAIVYLDQNGVYEQSCEVTVNITGAPVAEEV